MRMYQLFETKKEQKKWEEEKSKSKGFRICMRMTAEELKEELPFVDVRGYSFATIYTVQ